MSARTEEMFHKHGCVVCRWPKRECREYGDEMAAMVMVLKGCDLERAKRIVGNMGYQVSFMPSAKVAGETGT